MIILTTLWLKVIIVYTCGGTEFDIWLAFSTHFDCTWLKFISTFTRILPLKKAEEERIRAIRDVAASGFNAMLKEMGEVTSTSRWSRV